ncbi:EAL domain-containing protein [Bacillus sp. AK031]
MASIFTALRKKRTASISKNLIDTFHSPNSHFHSLFEHFPDIIIEFDRNGKVITTNKATTTISGYQLSDMNKMLTDYTPPEDKEKVREHFNAAVQGSAQQFLSKAYHKSGKLLNLQLTYIPIQKDDITVGVYAVIHEITDKYELEQALKKKSAEIDNVCDSLKAGIWVQDIKKNIITVCTKGIREISEINPADIVNGKIRWRDHVHKNDLENYDAMQNQLQSGQPFSYQYRIMTPSGKIKWIQDQAHPVFNEDGQFVEAHGIVYDITKDKELLEKVNYLFHHDSLTGLPNRKKLEADMNSLIEAGEKFAFIYINFDRIKYITDTLGSTAGDEIIKQVAQRLEPFNEQGMLVSRVSSDEFALVYKKPNNLEDLQCICKKAIEQLRQPFQTGEFELFLTVSIGASIYPSDTDELKSLFENAHAAILRAREKGKNNYQLYSPENSIDSYKRFTLEKDFRHALINGDLQVHYQPRVEIKNQKIVGAEALLRWEHPEWGTVSPNEFIPIAEENGFIIEVGQWVLERVCEKIRDWKKKKLPSVPISVNFSPQHFLVKDLKITIASLLKKYSVPAHLIELEITEAAFLQNEETVIQTIKELRSMGIKIFIDDFGMGFTSFSYLRDLNIDGIKIDRTYVKEIGKNEKNNIIVKSLLDLSEGLSMSTIVEGVETKEQLNFLKKVNCKLVQGYLYSKPVSSAEFIELLGKKALKPSDAPSKSPERDLRNFYRLQLTIPLEGRITIKKINDKAVSIGKTPVVVNNIGPGGLSFVSHIQFPVRKDMQLELHTEVMGKQLICPGQIVWKEETDKEFYRYGVEFSITEAQREYVTKVLNQLTLALKQSAIPPQTNIIEGDPVKFLKSINNISS